MNVDEVKGSSVKNPTGAQESFSTPFAFGEKLLREFCFLFRRYWFNASRMNSLAINGFKLVSQKVPDFNVCYGIVYEIQIA